MLTNWHLMYFFIFIYLLMLVWIYEILFNQWGLICVYVCFWVFSPPQTCHLKLGLMPSCHVALILGEFVYFWHSKIIQAHRILCFLSGLDFSKTFFILYGREKYLVMQYLKTGFALCCQGVTTSGLSQWIRPKKYINRYKCTHTYK